MEPQQKIDGNQRALRDGLDCRGHRIDIPEYFVRCDVSWLLTQLKRRFGSEQTPRADF